MYGTFAIYIYMYYWIEYWYLHHLKICKGYRCIMTIFFFTLISSSMCYFDKEWKYWTKISILHVPSNYMCTYFTRLTCIFSVLWVELTFALVKAMGPWQDLDISLTNLWSGIRIPTSDVPGLRSGFKSSVLSNTTVTAPGSNSDSSSLLTVTLPHLTTEQNNQIS